MQIACHSFARYVYYGSARAPTTPDRETFETIFRDHDPEIGQRGKARREGLSA